MGNVPSTIPFAKTPYEPVTLPVSFSPYTNPFSLEDFIKAIVLPFVPETTAVPPLILPVRVSPSENMRFALAAVSRSDSNCIPQTDPSMSTSSRII